MSATITRADSSAAKLSTYRAAVVHEFAKPLTVERVPTAPRTRPLDTVNGSIADVEAGRVVARIVLQP